MKKDKLKKNNKNKFCVKNISWPKKAYGVMIPIFRGSETYWLYTAYSMLVNLEQAGKLAQEFQEELKEHEDEILASGQSVIIFELELVRLYKMTPDLWRNGGLEYSDADRNKLLMEAAKVPQLYEVLVTYWGDPKFPYAIAAAFYNNHNEDIDNFMKTTNWRVDTVAKTSAIYKIIKTYGYDWVKDEILNNRDKMPTVIN